MPQAARKSETTAPAGEPSEAEGVTYQANPLAPGLRFFRCEPYRATLSMPGCATRWRQAQEATGAAAESLTPCRGCKIGAAHAGERAVSYSALFGALICPRCRRGGSRMIGGRVCISCYNREREARAGKNARGTAPIKLQLRAVEYREVVDGQARRVRAEGVVDLMEPVVQTLRTTKGETFFAFAGAMVTRQGRLF